MTGVLVIDATVDVAQFWPSGESDADTVKLTLSSPGNAFRFRSSRALRLPSPTRLIKPVCSRRSKASGHSSRSFVTA